MVKIIGTERISLKNLSHNDAKVLYKYRSLEEVYRFQSWLPGKIQDAEAFIVKFSINSDGSIGMWKQSGIFKIETGELIGDCGYCLNSPHDAEIGYTIDPSFQGEGFGTEAVKMLIADLFNKKNVKKIIARTDPENIGSIRLLEKLKFSKEAHLINCVQIRGEWKDDLVFILKK